jgi:hypothetical protein
VNSIAQVEGSGTAPRRGGEGTVRVGVVELGHRVAIDEIRAVDPVTNARAEKNPPVDVTSARVEPVWSYVGLTPTSAFRTWACAPPMAATKTCRR